MLVWFAIAMMLLWWSVLMPTKLFAAFCNRGNCASAGVGGMVLAIGRVDSNVAASGLHETGGTAQDVKSMYRYVCNAKPVQLALQTTRTCCSRCSASVSAVKGEKVSGGTRSGLCWAASATWPGPPCTCKQLSPRLQASQSLNTLNVTDRPLTLPYLCVFSATTATLPACLSRNHQQVVSRVLQQQHTLSFAMRQAWHDALFSASRAAD